MMLLCARMTEVSMSMGWYLIPRSSMASSSAPTTNKASCLSAQAADTSSVLVSQHPEHKKEERKNKAITSVGVGELSAAEEAQVARPGPDRLGVPEAESGVEVVRLKDLLAVTAVVTAAVVSAVNPDLQEDD